MTNWNKSNWWSKQDLNSGSPDFESRALTPGEGTLRILRIARFRVQGPNSRGGGGALRISGCGCAARTLEPLAYSRASFSWILLPYTRVNSWFPWSSQPTDQFREK